MRRSRMVLPVVGSPQAQKKVQWDQNRPKLLGRNLLFPALYLLMSTTSFFQNAPLNLTQIKLGGMPKSKSGRSDREKGRKKIEGLKKFYFIFFESWCRVDPTWYCETNVQNAAVFFQAKRALMICAIQVMFTWMPWKWNAVSSRFVRFILASTAMLWGMSRLHKLL